MSTAKELEQRFGVSADEIAKIDEDATNGVLQGRVVKTVTGPGRPPLSDEPLQQLTFKEPASIVRAVDKRAKELGMRRSDYLRQLVENDLACVGVD